MEAPSAGISARRPEAVCRAIEHISRGVLRLLPRVLGLVAWLAFLPVAAVGQLEFGREPIDYNGAPTSDPVAVLQQKLDAGELSLQFDAEHGYLRAVLEALEIDVSSQVLVASKTSLQQQRISPRQPRAIYFNDETYIGWVRHGDVLEIMATDPSQGEIFYTLNNADPAEPRLIRDRGQCLSCHASSRTQDVPGGFVRSMYVNPSGRPEFGMGSFTTDQRSPFIERWGGWYVTGTHGAMRHMGNTFSVESGDRGTLDVEAGANVEDLSSLFDTAPYLTPHSDLVALMVLEHQVQMQNRLTRANFEARSAAHYDATMNAALDRPSDYTSETTERRIASAGDKLLEYMLFVDEFRLRDPVSGSTSFAADFETRGVRDRRGRSLRDLDLKTRMFKYPCSYLIYSRQFDALPAPMKSYVATRLHSILTGADSDKAFAHLSLSDRTAILEILTETKPGLWAR